jgi:hypothetical protein
LVEGFLVRGEDGIYFFVGVLVDRPAGVIVATSVGRGVVLYTIQGDVPLDEDDLELENLVVGEAELLLE